MKFCFFGNISGALRGQTPGGGELQVCLLATALALKGHEVVIIDPSSAESFVTDEGVKVINMPRWNKGVKGLRLFSYRIPTLWKTLVRENADYYYVRMRVYLHLIPYLAAKKIKGKFIVGLAHDLDALSFATKFKYEYKPKFNLFKFVTLVIPNDLVFKYLLKRSDYITLQHAGQELNENSIRGKAGVFPNIFDNKNLPVVQHPSKDYFIHVGTLTILKGAGNLYELIKSLDKKNTIIIVGKPKDKKSEKIYEQLGKMENVILKGSVEHKETIRLIANAKALISTSNSEGFPNIFLEAWATGVPVISLKVNPGNVINKYGLGICCDGDLELMKDCIEKNETRFIDKEKLKSYVFEFHDFSTAADRFLSIINN
ncbi:MAG TPA: glycosyltransferase [Chitinophagaceae bacterium]